MKKDIERAVRALKEGKIIIYPTETCYGIGCDATDEEAVKKVFEAKKRPETKKLTCIVSDLDMAKRYCKLSEKGEKLCREFMPGPLTFVAEKREGRISDAVNEDFAFRVSSDPLCRKLSIEVNRPVVATSANISGKSSRYSVEEMSEDIVESADVVLDRGEIEKNQPSTIAGLEEGELKVYREGPVSENELREFMEGVDDE